MKHSALDMPLVPNPLRVNIHQALVVLRLDSAILRINHCPVDSVIDFHNTYLLIVIYLVNSTIQHLNICSLLSRQLEIVGARKSGRRRRRHARGERTFPHPLCTPILSCAHYFQDIWDQVLHPLSVSCPYCLLSWLMPNLEPLACFLHEYMLVGWYYFKKSCRETFPCWAHPSQRSLQWCKWW